MARGRTPCSLEGMVKGVNVEKKTVRRHSRVFCVWMHGKRLDFWVVFVIIIVILIIV